MTSEELNFALHLNDKVTDNTVAIFRLVQWNLFLMLALLVSVYILWQRTKSK